ncbi:hypothetical protein jhhlp_005681 [Lomentospora prolificans]|uniref:Oxidation resistance protein 1 n=1 Tax=Lomentospora prolificans TaxID=41688 RepID=A0A2N3N3U4_9PEZI|nr:hypothetical protein jhhlp_005681 [Lomentospora prolificans]
MADSVNPHATLSGFSKPPNDPMSEATGPPYSPKNTGLDACPASPQLPHRPSLSYSLSNMWSGLMRSFSSDVNEFPSQSSGSVGANASVDSSSSLYELPPLEPVRLEGYTAASKSELRLMRSDLAEEIRLLIPERLKLVDDWHLIYSLVQDGASLGTLYARAKRYRGHRVGFVLVLRDTLGGTFGAYLSEYPHPAPSYFGNGECFLWKSTILNDNLPDLSSLPPPPSSDTTTMTSRSKTLSYTIADSHLPGDTAAADNHSTRSKSETYPNHIRFNAFPYTGLNDFFMNCETGFFSIGAGDGHYGLWIDSSIEHGHSSRCTTFGNEPLSQQGEKFYIINAELWMIGA